MTPTPDKRFYRLKLFAGHAKLKKTGAFRLEKKVLGKAPIPKWTIDLDLSNIEQSERFQVEVYCRRGEGDYQCLSFYGASIQDVLIGETDIIVMSISSNSPCPNVSLKIFREGASNYSLITRPASEDQDMLTGPSDTVDPESQDTSDLSGLQADKIPARSVEDDWSTARKLVEETAKPDEPSEWISKLIDSIDIVKSLHPAASIAWGIISSCVNVLKQRTERDKTVLRLYEAMIMTYREASDDHLLWQQKQLELIYKLLFQTTTECGMLIKRYTNKSHFKHFFSLNVMQKAEDFIQGFANLWEQLDLGVAKDALVVTLGVRANVDILAMKTLLQELKPKQELGPKSTCMPGTRMETINYLLTWIVEYDDGILWCSGLAGTGKSALVGTLHNLLCFHMSGRSHLAAFIRYDRTEYRYSSGFIMSIAYSLGMFDQRIGSAIAKALAACRAAAKMPASEARNQFRLLLQEPLETIPELQDEGPLVVIIDGLDESDVSKELLELLADGFGPTLPFMWLIVSSRPEERISRVFKHHWQVHPFPLDTSSDEVKHDIRHFIQQRFASIEDKSVWGAYNEQDVITWLAERASGLFIWAATVCSFLCNFPSSQRLKVLLETTIPADAMAVLTILYQTALDTIVSEVSGTKEDVQVQRCIRAVLGALIVRKREMTVFMLPELVLHEGDPSVQFIIDKLGSVVQESEYGNLELIHKSFDDFLRDHGRCGDGWFIDVKEHEKELARRCMTTLTMFLEKWSDHLEEDQARLRLLTWAPFHKRETAQTPHPVVVHEAEAYSVNVFEWHFHVLVELGINTYHSLFERFFLLWVAICTAFSDEYLDKRLLEFRNTLLEIISQVNSLSSLTTILTIRDTGFPGFKLDAGILDIMHHNAKLDHIRCQMSPDGSKVAITDERRDQTCILGIMPGSGMDNITDPIEVIENVYYLAWFPDSRKIAYLQVWKVEEDASEHLDEFGDLVVQCLANRQSTTIHRLYKSNYCRPIRIFVTADGCRLIVQDQESFMTWDVSDL
ncbi:uncharacterized protein ARMOST_12542 [Armillaria ostoyae]|uniref:Nephrocystin 3-like N-terminal domain-containing protein n=1 Tax=Armillaria ostoyae TaxID=47428 RepID=A0A284RK80_ARMOS|nr:uncharacterized protein ARMOST_12542 [Armillaria ostoyae]